MKPIPKITGSRGDYSDETAGDTHSGALSTDDEVTINGATQIYTNVPARPAGMVGDAGKAPPPANEIKRKPTDVETNAVLPAYVGRFQIVEEIASGGMGVVVKAWDPQLQRHVAIKLLHEHLLKDADLTRRFYNEAHINGRLEHPSIVSVHEVGKCSTGRPYFAMRLLEGQTLAKLLANREENLSQQLTFLRMFEKIANGMAFAHSQGIIHRDLKPSNIIVGDFGMVKVMDWGLAKSLHARPVPGVSRFPSAGSTVHAAKQDDADTQFGSIVGTPAYLAPEQARGEVDGVDERADVFSLGGILCHILTGSGPYPDPHISKLEQAMKGHLKPALQRLDACSSERDVIELAKSCLASEPEHRPRSGCEVAEAITNYLESDLRRAERDLVRFFELSLDLFCIAGLDGYFKRINGNFTRVLGYSEAELLAHPFTDFIHPDDLQRTAEVMGTLSEGLPVVQFTNRYLHADGHYLCLEWVAKVEEEGGGNIYAVARNVTNRYAAHLPPTAENMLPTGGI